MLRSWIMDISEKLTNRTVNRKISAIKRFFRFLHIRGYLAKDNSGAISGLKQAKRLPKFIMHRDISQLLEDLAKKDDFKSQSEALVIEVLYSTGMRRAELLAMTVHDIDLGTCTIKVLGKGNKIRLIPFGRRLAQKVETYLLMRKEIADINEKHVFLRPNGKKMYPKYVYNLVKKYLSLITTQAERGPHVLRHSFATHMADNGAELNSVKTLLGHSSLAATQIYTHNSIESLKRAYKSAHPKSQ